MTKTPTSKKTSKKKAGPATKKKVAKRTARKKVSRVKKKPTRKRRPQLPRGFAATPDGLLIPASISEEFTPVPPEKIRSGLAKAGSEIQKLMEEISDLTEGYSVSEIELAASFSADGKFLGIGVGGATTIKVRFKPDDTNGG